MDKILNKNRQQNSQNTQILEHLQSGFSLTPKDGYEKFGTMNLAQRIFQLRGDGYDIQDKWIDLPNGKKVKEYWVDFVL